MYSKTKLIILFLIILYSCKNKNSKVISEDCINLKDTTIHLKFSFNPDTLSFYKLVDLINKKTNFRPYVSEETQNEILIHKDTSVYLYKKLGKSTDDNSLTELNILDNVSMISGYFVSQVSSINNEERYPNFSISQMNFVDENEKTRAFNLIEAIGYGNRNHYKMIHTKKNIYIVSSCDSNYYFLKDTFSNFILKEHIQKSDL